MARGRKKTDNAKKAVISIRITESQKDIIEKNKWIKKEIDNLVRDYINIFSQ